MPVHVLAGPINCPLTRQLLIRTNKLTENVWRACKCESILPMSKHGSINERFSVKLNYLIDYVSNSTKPLIRKKCLEYYGCRILKKFSCVYSLLRHLLRKEIFQLKLEDIKKVKLSMQYNNSNFTWSPNLTISKQRRSPKHRCSTFITVPGHLRIRF